MRLRGFCAAAAACFFVAAHPALAASPVVFTDGGGDAPGAPDVTTVVVSNDDSGTIRFRINISNQQRLASDSKIYLYIDADKNPATGAPDALGADYQFLVDGANQAFTLGHWNGSAFDFGPTQTARAWYWSGISITVNRSELGGTGGFDFWVETQRATVTSTLVDDAGKTGGWAYDLQTGGTNPADIHQMLVYWKPRIPRAGAAFTFRISALVIEGAAKTVRPDRYSCKATLGKRTLSGRGLGGCNFRLGRSARGKKLTLTVTVAYRGEVVSASKSFVVR